MSGDAERLELDNWNATRLLFQWAAFHGFPPNYNEALANKPDKFLADRAKSSGATEGALRRGLQALLSGSKVRLFPPDVVNSEHPEYSATFMTALTHAATVDPTGSNRLWSAKVVPFVHNVTNTATTKPADLLAWNAALERVRQKLPNFSPDVYTDVRVETPTPEELPISPIEALEEIREAFQVDLAPIVGATKVKLTKAVDLADAQRIANAGFDALRVAIAKIVATMNEALPR